MSFKTKTILLLITLSLIPYVITMIILGKAYRSDYESRLKSDMNHQLLITTDRLDQSLEILENDLRFIASLDIMNDVLTDDLDRRIFKLLSMKKEDMDLIGSFDVINTESIIVASSDTERIGKASDGENFMRIPLFSTFDQSLLGGLLVNYDLVNLSRLFSNDTHLRYSLYDKSLTSGEVTYPNNQLIVKRTLQNRPELTVLLEQDYDFAFAVLDKLASSFYMTLIIGTLLITAVAYATANYILKPILLLSNTANTITRTQDYSKRVTIERTDEIGQLSLAFNSMISGMQQMLVRLNEESENRIKLAEEKNRSEMLQNLSTKLSKYLSPQVFNSIFSGERDVTLSSSRKKLTIFFSDIVDFTGTTDKMESEDLTQLLNHYLREMTDIALKYGATIDKYIGDAIMIFFGDPDSQGLKEDAKLCVEMAISMQNRVRELQSEWQANGYIKPFSIRAGIHTGYCTVGNFGTENRMDYTIVGSAVNLASRIESNAEPGNVFISEDTFLLVRDTFDCCPATSVTPKGFSLPVKLFKVKMEDDAQILSINEDGLQLIIDKARITEETRKQLRGVIDNMI